MYNNTSVVSLGKTFDIQGRRGWWSSVSRVCIEVSTPSKTSPVFLAKPSLNLQTVCNPLFSQSLLCIGFLWTPLKTIFFGGPQKYYIFSSLKVHWHIFKKKYCFCGKTCQYSPLLGTPRMLKQPPEVFYKK